jgi:hypothetical protein
MRREAMLSWNKQFDFVGMDFYSLELFFLNRELRYSEIGLIIQNCLHDASSVGAINQQLHIGELLFELGKNARQDVYASGFISRDDQFTPGDTLKLINHVLSPAAQGENLFGVLSEDSTRNGQRDPGSETLEKSGIQLLFELSNLGANRRLRAIARLRGLRETLQPHNLQERVELIQIHVKTAANGA